MTSEDRLEARTAQTQVMHAAYGRSIQKGSAMVDEKPVKITERKTEKPKEQPPAVVPDHERRAVSRYRPKRCTLSYVRKAFFSFMNKPGVDKNCAVNGLSRAGVQFLCNEDLKRGQRLIVSITLRNAPPIRIVGEVVWIGEVSSEGRFAYRVGVHFIEYLGDAWRRLCDWEGRMEREAAETS